MLVQSLRLFLRIPQKNCPVLHRIRFIVFCPNIISAVNFFIACAVCPVLRLMLRFPRASSCHLSMFVLSQNLRNQIKTYDPVSNRNGIFFLCVFFTGSSTISKSVCAGLHFLIWLIWKSREGHGLCFFPVLRAIFVVTPRILARCRKFFAYWT